MAIEHFAEHNAFACDTLKLHFLQWCWFDSKTASFPPRYSNSLWSRLLKCCSWWIDMLSSMDSLICTWAVKFKKTKIDVYIMYVNTVKKDGILMQNNLPCPSRASRPNLINTFAKTAIMLADWFHCNTVVIRASLLTTQPGSLSWVLWKSL